MAENAYDAVVRHAFEHFEDGDLELLRVVMADDVVWHEPGRSAIAGDYSGPEAVLGFLAELKRLSNGTFRAEVTDILSEPERAMVVMRETAELDGRALDELAVADFEIHHKKITEVTVYHYDTYSFDEFWGPRER